MQLTCTSMLDVEDVRVYLIICDYDESSWVEGAYSTYDKAKSQLEVLNSDGGWLYSYHIKEVVLQ